MKRRWAMGLAFLGWCSAASAQVTTEVSHAWLQAVNEVGFTTNLVPHPIRIRGVVLNDPEEMMDPAYDPTATATANKGGEFQLFIQGVGDDRGGTALWMAQNYDAAAPWKPGIKDYDAEWTNEMMRVRQSGFRKGDLVEVTARISLFYGGKWNINENHSTNSANDYDISIVKENAGLPQAEAIALSDLVAADGAQIFDATRATGGEHWQGMRVRLDGIRLADTNGWGKANWDDRTCMATNDHLGRGLKLRLPRTDLGAPPSTSAYVSAVGILNQESGSGTSGTNGYELFVQEIGPILSVGTHIVGSSAVSFSADYEGYVLEASDDGLQNWSPVDAMPVKVIVIEDDGDSPNRAYRLRKVD
ncbi:MAG: hypothetical protein EOM72_06900 [Opitutae bacterium]|nr:hypothetical protein [Opitutae bacterium]